MCVAISGKVLEVMTQQAVVSFEGIKKVVDTTFVEPVYVGEYVLVHAGCAIEKLSEEASNDIIEAFALAGVTFS